MTSDIKRLGKHTLVYGVGYVLTRMIPFFLLPFYTHYISLSDYGVIQLIYAAIGFMNIIYHYGLDSAFLRFFSKQSDDYRPADVFVVAFSSLFVTGVILTSLIVAASEPISRLLLHQEAYSRLIAWSGLILLLDTLVNIPLHYLRMVNRPLLFTGINLVNVTVNLVLNVIFIAYLKKGIEYVFISNAAASLLSLILLLPIFIRNWNWHPPKGVWKLLVIFGLPFIPGGLASMILELIDRYMLEWMTNMDTVGLYSAGYKLGIFMLVVITAYKFAWQPFFLNKGDTPETKMLFGRIMTYFITLLLGLFLLITFFIHEIITFQMAGVTLFGENYWGAESVVPVILAAYIFLGIYMNLLPAIYFTEKTGVIPLISGSSALVNVIACYVLIGRYGMMGAAWATLIAYAWMAILTYLLTKKWYPVPYEWEKIAAVSITALAVLAVWHQFFTESMIMRLLLLAVYTASIVIFNIVSPRQLKAVFRRS